MCHTAAEVGDGKVKIVLLKIFLLVTNLMETRHPEGIVTVKVFTVGFMQKYLKKRC